MTRAIVKGFKKLIAEPRDPASFSRPSVAYNPETGAEVGVDEPRYVDGPFSGSKALFVDEWTTLKVPFDASLAGYGPGYVYVPSNKTRVVGGPRRTKAVLLSRS